MSEVKYHPVFLRELLTSLRSNESLFQEYKQHLLDKTSEGIELYQNHISLKYLRRPVGKEVKSLSLKQIRELCMLEKEAEKWGVVEELQKDADCLFCQEVVSQAMP